MCAHTTCYRKGVYPLLLILSYEVRLYLDVYTSLAFVEFSGLKYIQRKQILLTLVVEPSSPHGDAWLLIAQSHDLFKTFTLVVTNHVVVS